MIRSKSHSRTPTEHLTDEEIADVKALRDAKTKHGAAKTLGLSSASTVVSIIAGEPVHRTTAKLVRAWRASA